jgi:hypothetical protein
MVNVTYDSCTSVIFRAKKGLLTAHHSRQSHSNRRRWQNRRLQPRRHFVGVDFDGSRVVHDSRGRILLFWPPAAKECTIYDSHVLDSGCSRLISGMYSSPIPSELAS